jgi:hypothetical protein
MAMRPTSSAYSSDTSENQPRSVAWQKRKADDSCETDREVRHGSHAGRKSNSPLAKVYRDAGKYGYSSQCEKS